MIAKGGNVFQDPWEHSKTIVAIKVMSYKICLYLKSSSDIFSTSTESKRKKGIFR